MPDKPWPWQKPTGRVETHAQVRRQKAADSTSSGWGCLIMVAVPIGLVLGALTDWQTWALMTGFLFNVWLVAQ